MPRATLQAAIDANVLANDNGRTLVDTRLTITNFIHLMDELVEAYPGTIITSYTVSQCLLKRFFYKMAHGTKKRTCSSVEISALIEKLMDLKVLKWASGFRTDDDY